MIDKREHPRLSFKSPLRYRLVGNDNLQKSQITHDVSRGGISFVVSEPLSVGNVLEVIVELEKNDEAIHAIIEIVWTKKLVHKNAFKVGAKFVMINSCDKIDILEQAFNQWATDVAPLI